MKKRERVVGLQNGELGSIIAANRTEVTVRWDSRDLPDEICPLSDLISLAKATEADKELAAVACQIAYEYPDWDSEHVSDMYDSYDKAPFSFDQLYDATEVAASAKKARKSFDRAVEIVLAALLA